MNEVELRWIRISRFLGKNETVRKDRDIKYVNGSVLQALSKTGLEALACGLKVLNYRLEYVQHLPTELEPKNVVSKVSKIYSEKRRLSYSISSLLHCLFLDFGYVAYILLKSFKTSPTGHMSMSKLPRKESCVPLEI